MGLGVDNTGSDNGANEIGSSGNASEAGGSSKTDSAKDDNKSPSRTDVDTFQRELSKTPEKKDANENHGSDLDQVGGLVDTWSDTGWGAIAETFGCAPCHFVLKEPDDSSEDTIP